LPTATASGDDPQQFVTPLEPIVKYPLPQSDMDVPLQIDTVIAISTGNDRSSPIADILFLPAYEQEWLCKDAPNM
jgi:hypothetical protein